MAKEFKFMKGNEAFSEALIRAGADGYFGYPITPQSEVLEYLTEQNPIETTGMVVLQAESEVAAINMIYGGAGCGKKVCTSSSSPGMSLKMEGISYMAGAELPALLLNVVRGGPGLGTIQPSQSDYFQAVKGGGHGDYKLLVLAPNSVQEMVDFVDLGFELAFKYRNPVMVLSDGVIGQMMEKVELPEFKPRLTDEEVAAKCPWATTGKKKGTVKRVINSLSLDAYPQEERNHRIFEKYDRMEQEDVMFEKFFCEDAEYLIVAYGSSSRFGLKAVEMLREKGVKAGLLRPITLFPFPKKPLMEMVPQLKGIISLEMSKGQMVEDVKLAVECKVPVEHFGRVGGVVHSPIEVYDALIEKFNISVK